MKKNLIFLIAFLLLFSGCSNFSDGSKLVESLEAAIELESSPSMTISVLSDVACGQITSSTSVVKKVTESFEINLKVFTGYTFIKWEAVNVNDSSVSMEEYLKFDDATSIKTQVHLLKYSNEILIQPVYAQNFSVTKVYPDSSQDSFARDSSIVITFNQNIYENAVLDDVDISISGIKDPWIYYEKPVIFNNAIQIIAKTDNRIEVDAGNTKIVKVKIPSSVCYQTQNKFLSLDEDYNFSFTIDDSTCTKASITFSMEQAEWGTFKVDGVTAAGLTSEYSIGNKIKLIFNESEDWCFTRWSIGGKGASTGVNISYDEDLIESSGYDSAKARSTAYIKVINDVSDIVIGPVAERRPKINSVYPTDGSSKVDRNVKARIIFSEAVNQSSLKYTITDGDGNSLLSYFLNPVWLDEKTVLLRTDINNLLPSNTQVNLCIDKSLKKKDSDISVGKTGEFYSWNFTTGTGYDNQAPEIKSISIKTSQNGQALTSSDDFLGNVFVKKGQPLLLNIEGYDNDGNLSELQIEETYLMDSKGEPFMSTTEYPDGSIEMTMGFTTSSVVSFGDEDVYSGSYNVTFGETGVYKLCFKACDALDEESEYSEDYYFCVYEPSTENPSFYNSTVTIEELNALYAAHKNENYAQSYITALSEQRAKTIYMTVPAVQVYWEESYCQKIESLQVDFGDNWIDFTNSMTIENPVVDQNLTTSFNLPASYNIFTADTCVRVTVNYADSAPVVTGLTIPKAPDTEIFTGVFMESSVEGLSTGSVQCKFIDETELDSSAAFARDSSYFYQVKYNNSSITGNPAYSMNCSELYGDFGSASDSINFTYGTCSSGNITGSTGLAFNIYKLSNIITRGKTVYSAFGSILNKNFVPDGVTQTVTDDDVKLYVGVEPLEKNSGSYSLKIAGEIPSSYSDIYNISYTVKTEGSLPVIFPVENGEVVSLNVSDVQSIVLSWDKLTEGEVKTYTKTFGVQNNTPYEFAADASKYAWSLDKTTILQRLAIDLNAPLVYPMNHILKTDSMGQYLYLTPPYDPHMGAAGKRDFIYWYTPYKASYGSDVENMLNEYQILQLEFHTGSLGVSYNAYSEPVCEAYIPLYGIEDGKYLFCAKYEDAAENYYIGGVNVVNLQGFDVQPEVFFGVAGGMGEYSIFGSFDLKKEMSARVLQPYMFEKTETPGQWVLINHSSYPDSLDFDDGDYGEIEFPASVQNKFVRFIFQDRNNAAKMSVPIIKYAGSVSVSNVDGFEMYDLTYNTYNKKDYFEGQHGIYLTVDQPTLVQIYVSPTDYGTDWEKWMRKGKEVLVQEVNSDSLISSDGVVERDEYYVYVIHYSDSEESFDVTQTKKK